MVREEPDEGESPERRHREVSAMTRTARTLRQKATHAEQRLWELVRARRCGGYRFLRQAVVGHWVLDFYCPAARLAIEVDGSVHHTPEARQKDAERDAALREETHIRTLRLTNDEVLDTEPDALTARIIAAVEASTRHLPPPEARPARLR
jgi:very-short-patch-repair endonuclease